MARDYHAETPGAGDMICQDHNNNNHPRRAASELSGRGIGLVSSPSHSANLQGCVLIDCRLKDPRPTFLKSQVRKVAALRMQKLIDD